MVPGYATTLLHAEYRCPYRLAYGISSHTDGVSHRCSTTSFALVHTAFSAALVTVTNVIFSNGRLDPWSEMGVVDQEQAGTGVKVIMMEQAAHHLDLFFEHPLDPQDVLDARRVEMDMVETWVDQAYRVYSASHDSSSGGKSVAGTGGDHHHAESTEERPSWLERVPSLTADW